MKSVVKIASIIAISVFCIGWMTFEPQYDVRYEERKIGSGDTLWDIAEVFYGENEFHKFKPMCFNEYYDKVTDANSKLTEKDKFIHPGQTVRIPIYTLKK